MSDMTMMRVPVELRDKLKAKAKAEGRTLEWMIGDAINEYLAAKPFRAQTLDEQTDTIAKIAATKYLEDEPKTERTDDWGA